MKPIYCVGCHDVEVFAEGEVCATCRECKPEDWVKPQFYRDMLAMAFPRVLASQRMVLVLPGERADTEVGCG